MAKPESNQPQSLSKEDVTRIVNEQLRNREFERYITSLMQGTDLESRIRDSVSRVVKQYLSEHVAKSVDEYARSQLPDKIRLCILDQLPKTLPPLIKGEILERLGNLNGVANMLHEFKQQIHSEMTGLHNEVQAEFAQHRTQLQGIRNQQAETFNREVAATAASVVQGLVGTNGQVNSGFRDELARQNNEQFTSLRTQNQHHLMELNTRCNRLEQSMSTAHWTLYALGFGLVLTVSALCYAVISK